MINRIIACGFSLTAVVMVVTLSSFVNITYSIQDTNISNNTFPLENISSDLSSYPIQNKSNVEIGIPKSLFGSCDPDLFNEGKFEFLTRDLDTNLLKFNNSRNFQIGILYNLTSNVLSGSIFISNESGPMLKKILHPSQLSTECGLTIKGEFGSAKSPDAANVSSQTDLINPPFVDCDPVTFDLAKYIIAGRIDPPKFSYTEVNSTRISIFSNYILGNMSGAINYSGESNQLKNVEIRTWCQMAEKGLESSLLGGLG